MARIFTRDWYLERLPALPDDLEEWTYRNHVKKFMFVDKENMKGWCTACEKNMKLKKPRVGKYGVCPKCGARVKFEDKVTKSDARESVYVQYCGMLEGHLCVRYFQCVFYCKYGVKKSGVTHELSFDVGKEFLSPTNNLWNIRSYKTGKDCTSYWSGVKNYGWRRGRFALSGGSAVQSTNINKTLYPNNLESILSRAGINHSEIETLCSKGNINCVQNLINAYKKYPQIEYFLKLGFDKLALEIANDRLVWSGAKLFDENEHDVRKFMGVNKKVFAALPKEISSRALVWRKRILLNFGVEITDEKYNDYRIFLSHFDDFHLYEIEKVMSLKSYMEYYQAQTLINKISVSNFTQDYYDYLKWCKQLDYDLNDTAIKKPHNFKEMHDRTMLLVEIVRSEKKQKEYEKAIDRWLGLTYSEDEMKLMIPKDCAEITIEGRKLSHCVGGYIDRVISGSSIICFVRNCKEEKEPFVTVEINTKEMKIIQARGKSNCEPPSQVKEFLNHWKSKVLEPMRKEIGI